MTMGFLLDTNVLSELMRETPNPSVTAWLDSRAIHQLQTSTVSQAEILAGIAVMPSGKRREVLANGADQIFSIRTLRGVASFLAVQLQSTMPWSAPNAREQGAPSRLKMPK